MRKSILYLLATVSFSLSAQAQMIDASKVPQTVKSTFEKMHPGITPQWEFEEGKFDAEYKQNGKKIEILYDRKGNSAEKIDVDNVPGEMKNYISSNYRGEKLKKAKKLVSVNGEISYLGMVNDKKLIFDANGKFIEEKKD